MEELNIVENIEATEANVPVEVTGDLAKKAAIGGAAVLLTGGLIILGYKLYKKNRGKMEKKAREYLEKKGYVVTEPDAFSEFDNADDSYI